MNKKIEKDLRALRKPILLIKQAIKRLEDYERVLREYAVLGGHVGGAASRVLAKHGRLKE